MPKHTAAKRKINRSLKSKLQAKPRVIKKTAKRIKRK